MTPLLSDQPIPIPRSPATYQKILVAVDYLDTTAEIFKQAIQLAQANHSQLMIFHCLQGAIPGQKDYPSYTALGAYGGVYSHEMIVLEEQLMQEATEELHRWLEGFVRRAKETGIEADSDYRSGDPGSQICAIAQEWGADLIVIGRRGRTGLSELLLGSVSNYVTHHAPCSVLVIQH